MRDILLRLQKQWPRTPPSSQALVASLNAFIDEWHEDAATSRLAYFDKIAPDGIYIGTDQTERWNRAEFRIWAAESFAKPSAWVFTPLHRNIFVAPNMDLAWFDEQLASAMGVLQASGIVRTSGEELAILHYQLSLTIPNNLVSEVIKLRAGERPSHA